MDKDDNRPPRPDFLDSAEDILDKLHEPDARGRKSRAEPGPRRMDRHDSIHSIGYTLVNDKKETLAKRRVAISLNVATHGVALKTSDALQVGDLLMLDIHIRNERAIYALGEVIHCRELRDGTFESGVKFLDISEGDYELLLTLFP
ncbi:MAG: PilZ domain-containing protein [Planctomycetes bacterium]|nr:PilZ domain-containing protein [Planctomycetota bacterium]